MVLDEIFDISSARRRETVAERKKSPIYSAYAIQTLTLSTQNPCLTNLRRPSKGSCQRELLVVEAYTQNREKLGRGGTDTLGMYSVLMNIPRQIHSAYAH